MEAMYFMALGYAYKKGAHIRVTMFTKYFPKNIMIPVTFLFKAVTLVFFLVLAYSGWELFTHAVEIQDFTTGMVQFPMSPSYFMVPLGGILISLRIILSFCKSEPNDEAEPS
ncbi:hypothetical protein DCCM_0675 [Desulfocucumis palustris]|uniref:Tripartite ATP-independent periplasmic transporters DctQ component domain-containing protein n=2 Tax=Desulfocucumis palustris TaxID=1898651 RepID=A0A2L2X8E2_9FIRM|nr:hypothetical protein DCCM_0675 [Desulfocucumis palustris]